MRCEKVLKTFWPPKASLRVVGQGDARFQVDDGATLQQRRVLAANEPGVEVVDPGAEIVQTSQQAYPPQALVDGGVPADPGNAALQAQDISGGEQVRLFRHFRVGVVQRVTEGRVAAQCRWSVG